MKYLAYRDITFWSFWDKCPRIFGKSTKIKGLKNLILG